MSEFSQLPIHPHIQRVAARGREPYRFQPTSGRIPGATQERLSLLDRWQARYGIGDDTSVAQADLTYTNPTPQPPAEPSHPLSEVARSIAIAKSTAPDSRHSEDSQSQPPQTFRVSRKAMPPDAVVPKSATATDSPQTSSLAPGETPIINRQTTPQTAIQPPGKPTPSESSPPSQSSTSPSQAVLNVRNSESISESKTHALSPYSPLTFSAKTAFPPDASVQVIAQAKPVSAQEIPKAGFIQRASSRSTPSTPQPPTRHAGDKHLTQEESVTKGTVVGANAKAPFANPLQRTRATSGVPATPRPDTLTKTLLPTNFPIAQAKPALPRDTSEAGFVQPVSSRSTPSTPQLPAQHAGDKHLPLGRPVTKRNAMEVSAETPLAISPATVRTAHPLQSTQATQAGTIPVARAVAVSSQPPSVQRPPDRSLTIPTSPHPLRRQPSSLPTAFATGAPPHQQGAEHSSASDREVNPSFGTANIPSRDRAIASTQGNRPVAIADAVPTPVTAAAPEMVWRKSATTSPEPAFSRPPTPGNGHSPPPIIQTAPAQSSQTREVASPPAREMTAATPSQSVNVAQLAEQVSRILYRQLRVERERRGMSP